MRKPEYDFFGSDGLYKIYNKDNRNHIIAVCENVFDAMIVIKALNHADVSVPHDCTDEIDAALDKLRAELEEKHKEEIKELQEENEGAVDIARRDGKDEGFEEGKESRMPAEEIFDPS